MDQMCYYYVVIRTSQEHTCFVTRVPYRLESVKGLDLFREELKAEYGSCILLWWKRLEED